MCFKWWIQCFKPRIKPKGIFSKMLMDISVRYLHNDIIKPYENGGLESVVDSVTHKALIINTTPRSFIMPQFF